MTLFAVACAGIFPLIHVGRIWMMWFLAPVPNSNAIWQNFRSPLLWDVFAVSTYALVSLMFWYVGLIPDLATIRDRSRTRAAAVRSTAYWRSAGVVRPTIGDTTRRPFTFWPRFRLPWC